MYLEPKIRGFVCTTAHPIGCAQSVLNQINYVRTQPPIHAGPKKVLIIGASAGYGLASRITTAFGAQAETIAVSLERPADTRRTASAGWYHTAAFEEEAYRAGLYAKSINGDAFSDDTKKKTLELIQRDWEGEVDLVIYSLAAPRRTHPRTGETFHSVLKPIGLPYRSKSIDFMSGQLSEVEIAPATAEEIANTISVMGGEDWEMWIDALLAMNLLAKGAQTIAYSYIGPLRTASIYTNGTIGQAKQQLTETSQTLQSKLHRLEGNALISVNKALVTQASAAIPVVPLYIALLYKVMKAKQCHEGCIEQMYRLYGQRLYQSGQSVALDEQGRIRMDDWEMQQDVQEAISANWSALNNQNIDMLTDLAGYRRDFYQLFGFSVEGIDYTQPSDIQVNILSLHNESID